MIVPVASPVFLQSFPEHEKLFKLVESRVMSRSERASADRFPERGKTHKNAAYNLKDFLITKSVSN